ncbi:MAG: hypothetical protein CSA18_04250 [Deltaproteobacteria bacterium]|nr:MAG: hypothetical protein CSA18_04250 [Deltaproteobacteria bacterium]
MTIIKLREPDDDILPLIRKCSSEELDNLVGYITVKGGVSCQLKHLDSFRENYPEHSIYADEIAAEIQKFGGNTIFNIIRKGKGQKYKNIVCDVADHLKLKVDKTENIEAIEMEILVKVMELSWEKMTAEEKKALLKGIINETKDIESHNEFPHKVFHSALLAGGTIISYRLSILIANAIAKITLEKGIGIAAGTALSKWVSAFTGVIGVGITAIWTLFDFSGPAFRVTIPCVIHIAMLRQLHKLKDDGINPELLIEYDNGFTG